MGRILETYVANTPKSAVADVSAQRGVVGGNSRAAAFWRPHPITVARASGTRLVDLDGREYIDMVNNYTSLAHSHGYPPIVDAVRTQLDRGTGFTANNVWQMELAETLIDRVASVASVRFTNSGSEAGLLALTIARVVTGRTKVLMARYGYHGILMEFEAGSMPGLMPNVDGMTHLGDYNDPATFEQILDAHGHEIAAVVLEPVMGAGGVVSAEPDFLRRVQRAAEAAGALFVLDEVITFRLAEGGAQSLFGIEPDLTMFGKIIGGGFPVGAVGGKLEHLEIFDPTAPRAFHSGTYCGNPVTMAAGVVSVRELTAARIETMDRLAGRLADGFVTQASNLDLPISINRHGSLLNLFFTEADSSATSRGKAAERIELFHLAALNHGLMVASRGMMALSTVMDEALIDEVIRRAAAAMQDVAEETA